MSDGRKVYTRTPKQRAAWAILDNPNKRRILFDGGSRSGKTDIALLWLANQAATYPGARILLARKCLDHARTTLYHLSLKKLLGGLRGWHWSDSTLEIAHTNGSLLRVAGLDNDERVDKILGDEYLHIFINEATQVTWRTVNQVLTRLAQPMDAVHKLILDCNPKSQRHWLYRAGVLNQQPDGAHAGDPLPDSDTWARLSWTPYDNPHLPADALATLEAMTGTQRRRMLDGEWCEAEGAVYEEFDEDIHIINNMPAGWQSWPVVCGIDFGYTNPFVHLWGCLDSDRRLYIFREHYQARKTVQEHAGIIKAAGIMAPQWTVADHDAEDRATLRAAGIATTAATKDVSRGISAVKERLKVQPDGRPRLFILDICKELIAEFYDYVWGQARENKNAKEEPVKDRDHAMDTLRYMVMQLDGRPVHHEARAFTELPRPGLSFI